MGEELINGNVVIRDELGAVGLPLRREGPGADQRDLPAQQVRAHVERDLTALADIAGRSPGSCRAHRGGPRIASTGLLERASITSFAPNSRASLRRSGEMSSAMTRAPMATASCVAESPTGPWPKMAMISPPCRLSRFNAP